MKLKDLEIFIVAPPAPGWGGRYWIFTRLTTDTGIVGYGECYASTVGPKAMRAVIEDVFERHMLGENPENLELMYRRAYSSGFTQRPDPTVMGAFSGLEIACWDILGKARNRPVYALLGGRMNDRIRSYTYLYPEPGKESAEFWVDADAAAEAALRFVNLGFTAVKFDLDQANDPARYDRYNWTASPGELQRMFDQMNAARKAVGPNMDICADMHGRYDLPTALAVAKSMEPIKLMWLEEPLPAENIDAYRLIAQETSTPICAGENIYLAHGFRKLLEIGGADIIMPDLQKAGGLGEGQRIANLANLYYVPFAPHMVASYLGAMAACHVCASVPNFMILEWQIYYHKEAMWKEIVTFDGPMVENGFITLSEKPGIGVEINEEGMRKYAAEGIPFFA